MVEPKSMNEQNDDRIAFFPSNAQIAEFSVLDAFFNEPFKLQSTEKFVTVVSPGEAQ